MSIKVTKDGRTLRRKVDYSIFRRILYEAQHHLCMICGRYTDILAHPDCDYSFHVAHRGSRGMGGAIRDDVLGPERGQVEGGKCGRCHRQEHNQG